MSFADLTGRLSEAVVSHLKDGEATYRTRDGEVIEGVPYMLDLNYEVLTPDQLAARIKTALIPVSRVPDSHDGDQLVTESRTWTCALTLEDDGEWRRIEVI